jgi:outer membrane protein assembly factor BamD (BamD/ComL family)
VQDKAWDQAADVGQRIIKEFPNSRMATEVRSMIDQIRDRASTMRS